MQLGVGLESISSYKRLSYNVWYALAEFVDNSTQSYFDNRDELDKSYSEKGGHLTVSIFYDKDSKILTIKDNSIGMTATELEDALWIAAKPPKEGGRSKYGMGMKTAACWLGDLWTIKTSKSGSSEGLEVSVSVPEVAESGNGNLILKESSSAPSEHFTEIVIEKLHRRFTAATIRKIQDHLRSIYRRDLKSGALTLIVQGTILKWEGLGKPLLKDEEGNEYKQAVDIEINGKAVTGWVGILASGGRAYGGFALLQNDRVIRGYPTAWKPNLIFGQDEGSNDLVNQRLCGELEVDGFQVSHTKDDISWQDDEQEQLEDALAKQCSRYRKIAGAPYKGADRRATPTIVINDALNTIKNELNSDELVDTIQLIETPPESVLDDASKLSIHQAETKSARIDVMIGELRVRVFVDEDARPETPYYTLQLGASEHTASVVINPNHSYMIGLEDSAVPDYFRQCVYDAIAEYKTLLMRGRIEPHTVRFWKDTLLRLPYKIHDDVPSVVREEENDEYAKN